MTPLEICEPLLQYICRLSRSARKGGSFEMNHVRNQVVELFDNMKREAAAEPALADHFDYNKGQLELVLMFFVDFMIKESNLPFASEWQELAIERHNEMAGDEKFFDLLDEALADPGDAVAPRLAVYYACIGLGFTGWYTGQAEHLRKKMLEVSARIRRIMDVDSAARICPDTYEHTDTSDLIQPPGTRLVGIFLVAVSLVVVLFVANVYLYRTTSDKLRTTLTQITQTGQSRVTAQVDDERSGTEDERSGTEDDRSQADEEEQSDPAKDESSAAEGQEATE